MVGNLRAVIVVDYQNVHLTGHGLFDTSRHAPPHEYLIDPLLFAQQLLLTRNAAQRPDMAAAVLRRVLAFRGQPSAAHDPKPYARNQAQKAQWERDRCVKVTLRPLRYDYLRDADGRVATDGAGRKTVTGKQVAGHGPGTSTR